MRTEEQKKNRKIYDLENKEKVRAWRKGYYWRNREKVLKKKREDSPKKTIRTKELRHLRGISKKYNSEFGVSKTKEYRKMKSANRRALMRKAGKLSVKVIQTIYEDNIKRFGTLTCYICLSPIEFGKDHLEHKIPLIRGGTNEYNNLSIACQECNCKKHKKTYEEFMLEGVL